MPKIAAALAVSLTVVTCIGYNTARYPVVWEMAAPSGALAQPRQAVSSAAAPQSERAPPSASLAESPPARRSAASWESDEPWQPDNEYSHSPAWQPTTAGPTSMYTGHGQRSSSDAGEAGPLARVAMRGSWEGTSPDAQGPALQVVDPVAPMDWPATSPTSYGHTVGDAEDRPAAGDAPLTRADQPVEVTPSASYAFYPFAPSTPASESRASSPHDPQDQADRELAEAPSPESTLVPVKPPETGFAGSQPCDAESSDACLDLADTGSSSVASNLKRLPPVDQVCTLLGSGAQPPETNEPVPLCYPTASAAQE